MTGVLQKFRKINTLCLLGTTEGFIHHLQISLPPCLIQGRTITLDGLSTLRLIAVEDIIIGDLVLSLAYGCHRGWWSQTGISAAEPRIITGYYPLAR